MEESSNPQAKAVVYLRVARPPDPHLSDLAIDSQRDACERRAEELGLDVVREYCDYGTSGGLDQRPRLKELLSDLKHLRDVHWVIAYDHTRIARTVLEYTYALWDIQDASAELEIASFPHAHQDREGSNSQRMRRIGEQQHTRAISEKLNLNEGEVE